MARTDAAHRETTRREFAKQAGNFERPGSIFRDRDILEWIGEHVPVSGSDLVLDVAGGSGRLGRYLAETAAFAVVLDLTREMLEAGASSAREDGVHNVVFAEGTRPGFPSPMPSSTSSSAASPSITSTPPRRRHARWPGSAGPGERSQ